MVKTLCRLKLRITLNDIKSKTWLLVLVLLLLPTYILGTLIAVFAGSIVAGYSGELVIYSTVVILVGAVLLLGWILITTCIFGLDATLDPKIFSTTNTATPSFAVGLVLAGACTIPGVITGLIVVSPLTAWIFAGPLPVLLAVVSAVGGAWTCWLWSRLIATSLGVRMARSRQGKERLGIIASVLLVLICSPLLLWFQLAGNWLSLENIKFLAHFISWTPLGAIWALPGLAYEGAWLHLLASLLIAGGTIVLGQLIWLKILTPAMVGVPDPISAVATAQIASDTAALARGESPWRAARESAAEPTAQSDTPRSLPLIDFWLWCGLSGPASALAARCGRYWKKDPRYSMTISGVLVIPLIIVLIPKVMDGVLSADRPTNMLWVLPLMGMVIGQNLFNDISLDSSAFWMQVSSGIKGRDDRIGRVAAALIVQVPILILLTVVSLILANHFESLVVYLPLTLGLLCVSYGVGLVMGTYLVVPTKLPGASALSNDGTGQVMITMLIQTAQMLISGVLAIPLIVWAILSQTIWPTLSWINIPLCLIWGALAIGVGIVWGGRSLDQRAPKILQTIRSWPGH